MTPDEMDAKKAGELRDGALLKEERLTGRLLMRGNLRHLLYLG